MTPTSKEHPKHLPSDGGRKSQIIVESLTESHIEKLTEEIKGLIKKNGSKLDPKKTYIKPKSTLIQVLATSPDIEKAMLVLRELKQRESEGGDNSFPPSEEEIQALTHLMEHIQNIENLDIPHLTVDPEESSGVDGVSATMAAVQDMPDKFTEFLCTLREYDILKAYLRCLFTVGNSVRHRMTPPNCLTSAPILIFVNEVRMRKSNDPKEVPETGWTVSAFMPAGTIHKFLTWNESKQDIEIHTNNLIGTWETEQGQAAQIARLNYFPEQPLMFFSDSDLPLHPLFFEKGLPATGAFPWASLLQNNTDFWDYLRFEICPRLPEIFGGLERSLSQMAEKHGTIPELLKSLRTHRASLENPEFFLEFVLMLSALPRDEGVGRLDGVGGMVSGFMMSLLPNEDNPKTTH